MEKFDVNKFKGCSVGKLWSITHCNDNVILSNENNQRKEVSASDFMGLVFRNNITISDNKFIFEMVIGNDLVFYSARAFLDWSNILKKMEQNKISYADLKIGSIYQASDLVSNYLYLGKRWSIKWKYSKKDKKIHLTKPKQEHLFYEVYSWEGFKCSSPSSSSFKTFKNKCLISEVSFKNESLVQSLIRYYKEYTNILYFEDTKPKECLELYLEEVDVNYLYSLRDDFHLDYKEIFHKYGEFLIKNNYFIFGKTNRDRGGNTFARQVSKSDYNNVIFKEPANNELIQVDDATNTYYTYDSLLAKITTGCSNDNFRIAPENYYILKLK